MATIDPKALREQVESSLAIGPDALRAFLNQHLDSEDAREFSRRFSREQFDSVWDDLLARIHALDALETEHKSEMMGLREQELERERQEREEQAAHEREHLENLSEEARLREEIAGSLGGEGVEPGAAGSSAPDAKALRAQASAKRGAVLGDLANAAIAGAATEGAGAIPGALKAFSDANDAKRLEKEGKRKAWRERREKIKAVFSKKYKDPPSFIQGLLVVLIILVLFVGIQSMSWLLILAAAGAFALMAAIYERFRTEMVMNGYAILFWFLVIVHAILFRAGFAISAGTIFLVLVAFGIFGILYMMFASREGESLLTAFYLMLASIAMYAIAGWAGQYASTPFIQNTTIAIVSLFPVAPLYLLLKLNQFYGWYSHEVLFVYRILLAILAIGFFLSFAFANASFLPHLSLGGTDATQGVKSFFSDFWDRMTISWSKGRLLLNQTLNPGSYYTGQVEQNAQAPLGVKIESFAPIDDTIDNSTPIILYGSVSAQTFIKGQESVDVVPTCTINRKDAPAAIVDPPILPVVFGNGNTFQCEFPPLPRGTYAVKGSATFPFQTWAYVTYTFVDDEQARNLARQGLDIRKEFDIDPQPQAIYTSGPIMLGMGGAMATAQPIRITPDKAPYVASGTRIGMTLDSAWSAGTLNHVEKLEFKVPEPFYIDLEQCDRCKIHPEDCSGPEPDVNDPLMQSYTFTNTAHTVVQGYTSVSCPIGIKDADSARALVSQSDKVLRSFVGVAYYTYSVSSDGMVRVR